MSKHLISNGICTTKSRHVKARAMRSANYMQEDCYEKNGVFLLPYSKIGEISKTNISY